MGILPQSDHNCNVLTQNKIPDYARDYRNEYLFIRGIDKCFEYFLDNINKADKGVFENHRVDKIKKYINILEKAQRLNYLNDTTNIKIYDINLPFSNILLEKLGDFGDYYVDDEWEFDQEGFDRFVDREFPGYKNLVKCIELFHSKFKLVTFESLINWPDSDSDDGIDSDEIETMFASGEDSESDSDSDY